MFTASSALKQYKKVAIYTDSLTYKQQKLHI